jgi:cysteine synthase
MVRRLLGILPLSVLIGMLVAMWRKRRQLVPAVQPMLPHWLQPYLQPMLKRMRDRIAKDKFQDLRRQQKATRAGLSGGDDAATEWHAGLEEPQYEWRQLMNWRIIKWLVARARKHVTSYMDGRLHVDELDMERLSLRKRWDKQDIGQVRNLVGNTPMIAIHLRFMGKRRVVYMKCEQANLTGSLKDRLASASSFSFPSSFSFQSSSSSSSSSSPVALSPCHPSSFLPATLHGSSTVRPTSSCMLLSTPHFSFYQLPGYPLPTNPSTCRMALHILDRAYADGSLRPGDVIAEASSGNTGIAFSAIGSALGHPVVIFMPDFMSEERKALIRAYGAEIFEISRLQGGFVGSIRMAEDSKKDQEMRGNRVFLPRQFRNDINAEAHYLTTGPEILLQLAQKGLRPAAFVAGVGTGGTIMGVGRCMKENCSGAGGKGHVRLHPVEPAESPTLSTGSHQVCGLSKK